MTALKNGDTRRVDWLDLIRSLAITAVVLCHTGESLFYDDIFNINDVSPFPAVRLFAVSIHAAGRIGVPLFLFLTGYLLLDRKYETAGDVLLFWKNKLIPLILTYESWLLIYEIYSAFVLKIPFEPQLYLRRIFFLEHSDWINMWYMPMIIGVYLTLPMVSFILRAFPERLFLIPAFICFCYCFVFPNISIILPAYDIPIFKSTLTLDFTGTVYGLYLICGYFMKKFIARIPITLNSAKLTALTALLFVLSAASFAATAAFQMLTLYKGVYCAIWYNFSLLLVCALCLFGGIGLLFLNRAVPLSGLWNKISISAMGIYFIHEIVLRTLEKTGFLNTVTTLPRSVKMLIYTVICFAAAFLISEILAKIPFVSRLLLLRNNRRRA